MQTFPELFGSLGNRDRVSFDVFGFESFSFRFLFQLDDSAGAFMGLLPYIMEDFALYAQLIMMVVV